MNKKIQKATITDPGKPGRYEPYANLEDGRNMPMGLNMGERYEVGTTGIAEYIVSPTSGLWRFTPDESHS